MSKAKKKEVESWFSGKGLEEIKKRIRRPRAGKRVTLYDRIINSFLESDAIANTISVIRHSETKIGDLSGDPYTHYTFTIKGTKQKIRPASLRKKGRAEETDPKVYVTTSGDEILLVKIVDEAKDWFEENKVDLDKYLRKKK